MTGPLGSSPFPFVCISDLETMGLMLHFNPSSPFPLLAPGTYTHTEAKVHSETVDAWLDLRTNEIERGLESRGCRLSAPMSGKDKQELWFGLDVQDLLTPYVEIRYYLSLLNLQPGSTVVDLGAAYGRMGFVIGRHHPGVRFIGYEYVGERLHEAKRCFQKSRYPLISMEHADLSHPEFTPAPADVFFIYDYGTDKAIEKTLHDLRRISRGRRLTIIGRGRRCRMLIESRHPWLVKAHPGASEARQTLYLSVDEQSPSVGEGLERSAL